MTENGQNVMRHGLVLDLPGAPPTPHRVGDLNGHYFADQATLLEDVGLTLEQAQAIDADEGCPLVLVECETAESENEDGTTTIVKSFRRVGVAGERQTLLALGRPALNEAAVAAGVSEPEKLKNKDEVADAILAARQAAA